MRVRLDDVWKSFGPVQVVKGLNLDIKDGEFVVLLGASGCGKTTALRMIAGLETVSAGRILIGDADVTNVLPKYRDIAMVFQSYALYPHMSVADNIGYPLKLRRLPAAEREARVRAAAAKVRLDGFLDRYPRQLSGGQRQRVALARAMVRQPSAFLMDEPLSNLDAKLRGQMRAELKHLQQELGVTTVYVTHDQVEAMTLAHRVAVMSDGVVQQLAPPRQIYDDPVNLLVAGFIGSPPMNFIEGELDGGSFVAPDTRVDGVGIGNAGRTVLGFRPEHATVVAPAAGLVRGEVYSVEMTGAETIVTVAAAGSTLMVTMDADFSRPVGEPVGIAFEAGRACLFDRDTGARLRHT